LPLLGRQWRPIIRVMSSKRSLPELQAGLP
jgi:hypothetical protein